jgi:hypothetical protein
LSPEQQGLLFFPALLLLLLSALLATDFCFFISSCSPQIESPFASILFQNLNNQNCEQLSFMSSTTATSAAVEEEDPGGLRKIPVPFIVVQVPVVMKL